MKHASAFFALFALLGAVSIAPAYAAQLNTQSSPASATPPDSELLIFQDSTDGKPVVATPATKPAAAGKPTARIPYKATASTASKPVTSTAAGQPVAKPVAPQADASPPGSQEPQVNASLSPIAPNAPRPPRLVAPPGW